MISYPRQNTVKTEEGPWIVGPEKSLVIAVKATSR